MIVQSNDMQYFDIKGTLYPGDNTLTAIYTKDSG